MSITLPELLDEIEQDVVRLSHIWETFTYLFATDKKHVDVMNAVSGGFFFMIQQLLFDDAILRVSKLTDPAGNKHQENMSLERLLRATEWEKTDLPKWQLYRSRLDIVKAACKPCRDHRNKRVSHKALELFAKAISIHDPTMKMIDDARDAIHAFLHDIRIDLGHGSMTFDYPAGEEEAEKLIDYLSNRASQKQPDAVSIITYDSESRDGHFHCAFCGEKQPMRYYRDDGLEIPRLHWGACHGVVGFEHVAVRATDLTGAEKTTRFIIDLSKKQDQSS